MFHAPQQMGSSAPGHPPALGNHLFNSIHLHKLEMSDNLRTFFHPPKIAVLRSFQRAVVDSLIAVTLSVAHDLLRGT